jgi:hypothetical protein
MHKPEFKSYGYTLLNSYEDLLGKTVRAVFNISGTKKVFVTDACVLVTVSGVPMAANAVKASSQILFEIEDVTGITKNQYER